MSGPVKKEMLDDDAAAGPDKKVKSAVKERTNEGTNERTNE